MRLKSHEKKKNCMCDWLKMTVHFLNCFELLSCTYGSICVWRKYIRHLKLILEKQLLNIEFQQGQWTETNVVNHTNLSIALFKVDLILKSDLILVGEMNVRS